MCHTTHLALRGGAATPTTTENGPKRPFSHTLSLNLRHDQYCDIKRAAMAGPALLGHL